MFGPQHPQRVVDDRVWDAVPDRLEDAVLERPDEHPEPGLYRLAFLNFPGLFANGRIFEAGASAPQGRTGLDRAETEHAHVGLGMAPESIAGECLGTVFKQHQVMPLGERHVRIQRNAAAQQLGAHDGPGALVHRPFQNVHPHGKVGHVQVDGDGHQPVSFEDFRERPHRQAGHQHLAARRKIVRLHGHVEGAALREAYQAWLARAEPLFNTALGRFAISRPKSAEDGCEQIGPTDIEFLAWNHKCAFLPTQASERVACPCHISLNTRFHPPLLERNLSIGVSPQRSRSRRRKTSPEACRISPPPTMCRAPYLSRARATRGWPIAVCRHAAVNVNAVYAGGPLVRFQTATPGAIPPEPGSRQTSPTVGMHASSRFEGMSRFLQRCAHAA